MIDKYVALLRGINVGGNNIIKMSSLSSDFEKIGFRNVLTYIQSGNVIFSSKEENRKTIIYKIEQSLSRSFNYNAKVVLISGDELENIVMEAPITFGKEPDKYRYDVLFHIEPHTPEETMKYVTLKEGVDNVFQGKSAIYYSRLIAKASQSKMTKLIATPAYQNITIRNWNTTIKLYNLIKQ